MSERYDYYAALYEDIREALEEGDYFNRYENDRDDIYDAAYEDFWIDDGVTGNASGSYYCNSWKAEEAICHNLDLLGEALEEFGSSPAYLVEHGPEAADVTIRCYLLGQVLGEVLDDMEEEQEEQEEQ